MEKNMAEEKFLIENYGKKSTFASFLPGISGEKGIPIWCYYVNRGQCVVSFGVDNKDHSIMEFYPAHQAYQNVKTTGFRTFVKKDGKVTELFADENQFLGIVAVADVVKPTSKEAVQKFRDYGIHVIMLTGDNEVTAQAIKEQVGIDEVIAGVLPTQKEEKISALKQAGHKVAMIGDGVNDAPALASADVGIAIGAGTDVAIESADIVLMKNDLLDAVGAVKLSKAVIRNIKENLFWAFFYNSIGIPLAAGVLYPLFQIKLNPMFGAAAMSLSSVCVVSNALRLRWVKLHDAKKTQSEPYQHVAASTIADINQHNALDNNIKSTNNDKGESTMTTTISIEGMMCAHCQAHVEKALKEVAGVTEVTVSLENKNAVVTGDASVEALKQAVVDAGYEVTDVK